MSIFIKRARFTAKGPRFHPPLRNAVGSGGTPGAFPGGSPRAPSRPRSLSTSHPAPRSSPRAPRRGWNAGHLAVVAEAVEACLPSPWKPLAARPGRSFPEARSGTGPSPQLAPLVRMQRFRRRCFWPRAPTPRS